MIDIKEVQAPITEALAKIRDMKARVSDRAKTILEAKQEVLEYVSIYIHRLEQKENQEMVSKLGSDLIGRIVKMEDVKLKERKAPVKDAIVEGIKELQDAEPGRLLHVRIKPHSLRTKISKLKDKGVVPENVKVVEDQDGKAYLKLVK